VKRGWKPGTETIRTLRTSAKARLLGRGCSIGGPALNSAPVETLAGICPVEAHDGDSGPLRDRPGNRETFDQFFFTAMCFLASSSAEPVQELLCDFISAVTLDVPDEPLDGVFSN
jgi:hypothetical protein